MKHKTISNKKSKKLAKKLCALQYDSLSIFLKEVSDQLAKDAAADYMRGRPHLSNHLLNASEHVSSAGTFISGAWDVCKDRMHSGTEIEYNTFYGSTVTKDLIKDLKKLLSENQKFDSVFIRSKDYLSDLKRSIKNSDLSKKEAQYELNKKLFKIIKNEFKWMKENGDAH